MDVGSWLRGLGLSQYEEAFRENDINAEILPEILAEDLIGLGVISIGHRRKLLAAIAALREGEASPSASFLDPEPPLIAETAPTTHGAERRQLSVMFVDLVGSTALSAQLDPEEMGAVLLAYQNAVAGEIARFEGYVAKFMGDGVLVYFGWPRAHEDEAERAVRAGLAIAAAVAALRLPTGGQLAARVGIATGLVIVGQLTGEGEVRERSVVGETPNLAARLQALAPRDGVVVAPATRRLLGDLFELQELEAEPIKGLAEPTAAFRVVGERAGTTPFEARGGHAALPMEGRDEELALLLERWSRAKAGEGQAVMLVGEAGIGKSRIAGALIEAAGAEPHLDIWLQCSPYNIDSALWPITEHLRRAAGLGPDQALGDQLDRIEALVRQGSGDVECTAPLLAELLGLEAEQRYGPIDLSPQARRARTLQALADEVAATAARQPVLMVVEDAHWLDPSTLELVNLYLDSSAEARVLILVTSRPDGQPALAAHPHVTRLTLNRLGRAESKAIVAGLNGNGSLSEDVVEAIIARTDGVPLFVEEITKAMLENGAAGQLGIPASLHDSLMARLDRIPDVKEVAQIAACIGRVFDYRLFATIAGRSQPELAAALERLAVAGLVFRRGIPPDASYTFKHALVQAAAYESLPRSRRQALHRQIADALAERFPDRAATEPNLLAHHYAEAGLADQAVSFWQQAAEQAFNRSANQETIGHLTRGLAQLAALPETPARAKREFPMQRLLGTACLTVKGYGAPEVISAFARAAELRDLVQGVEVDRDLFTLLFGTWLFRLTRAEHVKGEEAAADLLTQADDAGDPGGRIAGHLAVAISKAHCGMPALARSHYEQGAAVYEAQEPPDLAYRYGLELGVATYAYQAWCLAILGHQDQALRSAELSLLTLEQNKRHAYTYARGLYWNAVLYQIRGEWPTVKDLGARAIEAAGEQNYAMVVAAGRIVHGAATAALGSPGMGIAEIREGLEAYRATGARFQRPYHLALLAETLGARGLAEEGETVVDEAIALVNETGERLCEPELYRQRGNLLLRKGKTTPAEMAFVRAIETARRQTARWWELRATRDLAMLWAEQREQQRACDLLAPIFGWFNEGFDTPDLQGARALLDELR